MQCYAARRSQQQKTLFSFVSMTSPADPQTSKKKSADPAGGAVPKVPSNGLSCASFLPSLSVTAMVFWLLLSLCRPGSALAALAPLAAGRWQSTSETAAARK